MSHVSPVPPPVAPAVAPATIRRPLVVTVAGRLGYLAAALALALALLPVPYIGRVSHATRLLYADRSDGDHVASTATAGTVIEVIMLVLIAGVLALFATFNLQGSNITRIGTWAVAGLGVLCCGGSGLLDLRTGDLPEQVNALAYPGWYATVRTGALIALVATFLVVIVLLLVPPAHPYFRPRMVAVQTPYEAVRYE